MGTLSWNFNNPVVKDRITGISLIIVHEVNSALIAGFGNDLARASVLSVCSMVIRFEVEGDNP